MNFGIIFLKHEIHSANAWLFARFSFSPFCHVSGFFPRFVLFQINFLTEIVMNTPLKCQFVISNFAKEEKNRNHSLLRLTFITKYILFFVHMVRCNRYFVHLNFSSHLSFLSFKHTDEFLRISFCQF